MLTEQEFKDLALLARLDPTDESLQGLRDDFNKILDFVNQINQIDTSSVDNVASEMETRNVTRKDLPEKTIEAHIIGEFAPQWEAGHFVVPGAIESEG